MSKVLAGVLILCGLSLAMSSCRREVSTIPSGQNPQVAFRASVGGVPQTDTRLTPSDITNGGAFEVGDTVGLYLFDQHGGTGGSHSYLSVPYVAAINDGGKVVFEPVAGVHSVFYKTYYMHDAYAYYPYCKSNIVAASAQKIKASVKVDQTSSANYALSDFLTCRIPDIKPQQIDPAAPELEMVFSHQFTSVVVKVRNGDNSEILPVPVVSVVNTAAEAIADITSATPTFSQYDNFVPIVLQQKAGYSNINFPTQLCYKGIVISQPFSLGKSVIKVKVGTGTTARVYEYAPQSTDPIFTAGGFVQGKEHVFDFVISGTELIVQGGEITDWGEGSKSVSKIDGGGQSAVKIIFEVINDTGDSKTKLENLKSANFTIDGKVRTSTSLTYNSTVTPSTITCNYYQGTDWGYELSRVELKDALGVIQMVCTPDSPLRIKGNPLDENYSTVIAVIDAQTGTIKSK